MADSGLPAVRLPRRRSACRSIWCAASIAIVLVLEATRRTVGWILPVTAAIFIVYGWAGPYFDRLGLSLIAHRGYGMERLVGTLFMTLEGIFGVPLDVASTYIILFTIYGAVLEQSGAGRFFIDWTMAAMGRSRSDAAPGRTVDARRLPPRHRLRQRRRDDRDAGVRGLAAAARCRLQRGNRRRNSLRRRHRRAALPADSWGRRIPDRRVPEDLVPARCSHGHDADPAVLPVDRPDDRGGYPPSASRQGATPQGAWHLFRKRASH